MGHTAVPRVGATVATAGIGARLNPTVLSAGQCTHIGQVRSRNEDFLGTRQVANDARGSLFLVADGMGGHSAGNVASKLAVEEVLSFFYQSPETSPSERLRQAVEHANRRIFEEAQANVQYFRMGTTLVGAAISGNRAHVANVGDSRAYMVREGHIQQVTRDHSWVALQVEMGELTPEEAQVSQNRSVLLRCLGEKADVLVDVLQIVLQPGDLLIMCTDGLHGLVTQDEIRDVALAEPPQAACERLVQMANERGGHDNITVEVVRVEQCPAPSEEDAADEAAALRATPETSPTRGAEPQAAGAGDGAPGTRTSVAPPLVPVIQVPPPATPPTPYVPPVPVVPLTPPRPTAPAPMLPPQHDALAARMHWLSLLLAFLAGVIVALVGNEILGHPAPAPSPIENSPIHASAEPSPTSLAPGATSTGGIPSPLPSGPRHGSPSPRASGGVSHAGSANVAHGPAALEEGVLVTHVHAPVTALVTDAHTLFWLEGNGPTHLRHLGTGGSHDEATAPDAAVPNLPSGRFHGLAVDDGFFYVGGENAIVRVPRHGGGVAPGEPGGAALLKVATHAPATLLCVSRGTLYWVEAASKIIHRTDLQRGHEASTWQGGSPVTGLAVDAADGTLLWAEPAAGVFARPAAAGPAAERKPLIAGAPTHLTADATHVYWTEEASDDTQETHLRRARLDGSEPTAVASLRGPVLGLAVDGSNVYWVVSDTDNFSIKRLKKK